MFEFRLLESTLLFGDRALATSRPAILAVSGVIVPVASIAPLPLPVLLLASGTHALPHA